MLTEDKPLHGKVNDSLTTGHLDKALTTAHIQQKLGVPVPDQSQGASETVPFGGTGQQQGAGDKK